MENEFLVLEVSTESPYPFRFTCNTVAYLESPSHFSYYILHGYRCVVKVNFTCWKYIKLPQWAADPDQTAPQEQSDQGLQCLPFCNQDFVTLADSKIGFVSIIG